MLSVPRAEVAAVAGAVARAVAPVEPVLEGDLSKSQEVVSGCFRTKDANSRVLES